MTKMSRDDPEHSLYKVSIDGRDISDVCIRFDDIEGWALLTDKTVLHGRVVLTMPTQSALQSDRRIDDAYGSHIPVLVGLAKMFDIRRVVEFGCGFYSTLTFLNRDTFPLLEKLSSFDDSQEWIDKIAVTDRRAEFSLDLPEIDFNEYDLIFVDDSAERRKASIKSVIESGADSILVFHDMEDRQYRRIVQRLDGLFISKVFNPHTGIKCTGDMNKLDNFILNHNRIKPTDIDGWVKAFASFDDYVIKPVCRSCGQ